MPLYDEAGNLVRKIAAGGVATCFWPSAAGGCSASALHSGGYDALNRPVVKRYSDGTPAVKWCYDGNTYLDGACQGGEVQGEKGYLTAVGNYVSSGDTAWTISSSEYKHQALGLVKWSKQVTGGNAYKFEDPTTPGDGGYVYDNGGRLTAMWYPSGRKVTYEYDGAGRVNVVGGQLGTNTVQYTSASNKISYAPHGAPVSVTFGNGLQETVRFNERLQPDLMQAGSLWKLENFYCPDGALTCTGNNGNILRQKVTVNGSQLSMQQDYTYDALNRLRTAQETNENWKQTYVYDATGNRALLKSSTVDSTMLGGTQFTPTVATDTAAAVSAVFPNNQWTAARYDWDAATGADYAAGVARAGNITALGGINLRYDAENRQISATNNATTTYAYDGEGRRVSKTVGGVTIHYVYDASGQLAAEYGSSTAPGLQYLTVDHLGSTRLVTGADLGQTPMRYDYLPFGEEIPAGTGGRTTAMGYSSATGPTQKFTGKERDSELAGSAMQGLDYFGARYFSAAQGRFTTPDWSAKPVPVPYADLSNPQSLNLYAYVRNNPLTNRDPDGHWCVLGVGTTCDKNIPPPPKPAPPPAPTNPVFPTADKAAVAAARLNQKQQKQTGFEFASSVFTIGPAYTYTNPVTQRKKGTVDPNNTTGYYSPKTAPLDKSPIPPGTQLVGETHSHPNDLGFSGQDIDRTHLLTLPALGHPLFQGTYVGQPNGIVIKWDPFLGRRIDFAPGEPE